MYKCKNKTIQTIMMPQEIGDGRVETLLKIFYEIKNKTFLKLNWQKVERVSPAGFAVLSCLFDSIIEEDIKIENVHIKKELKKYPVIKNLMEIKKYKKLPDPDIHNYYDDNFVIKGCKSLDIGFIETVLSCCGRFLAEDLSFSSRLISNELMQNSVSHSGAERFYIYAGKWGGDFHIGVLDMGVTIPAKLEQKYICSDDVGYLNISLKEGISTRRNRVGGLGLNHIFVLLKEQKGRLTILSRNAQIRRYFKRRVIQKGSLKYKLNGTWCFARFPIS